MLNKKILQTRLLEMGYQKNTLEQTLMDIGGTDGEIHAAIMCFVQDGNVQNISQPPLDVAMLMNAYGMNPIAALLFIDWYRKEPNDALQCLALGIDDITDIMQFPDIT